ncbi:MAG: carbon-nitrogen hydrolase family protein [Pseudomonadota bacterium]
MRVGLVQLCSGDDPAANLTATEALVLEAVAGGADFVLTPEVTNIVSGSRTHQTAVIVAEDADPTLARLRALAAESGIWLLIGSLALRTEDADGRFANRSFLIDPSGAIVARYDKIHMFDVDLDDDQSYRESAGYRPGERATVAPGPADRRIGMSICYDMRFPGLYRDLAQAGAEILTVPSAFTVPTGRAHWHVLLRARAIETGCFVLAPAQCGDHAVSRGPARRTYGHSLIVSPWGEVLAEAGEEPAVIFADLDLDAIQRARAQVPSLKNARPYVLEGAAPAPRPTSVTA